MFDSSREAGSFGENLTQISLEVTNGLFKCPAKKCSRFLTFEEFWKKDCCEDSRKQDKIYEGMRSQRSRVFISLLEYLERKRKFDTLQAEYKRAMENCREKKKASENAEIYRDAIGASVISTANSFADFLKSNGTKPKFDDLTKHTRAHCLRQPLGIRQRTHASLETLQKIPKNERRCVK
jgi:hypothetical protein